jgi:membrane AbrB-like protein
MPTQPSATARSLARVARTLAIGALGGALFAWLRMPLAWMMGAMVLTTVAALAKRDVVVPQRLRSTMIVVLGVLLGSGFTPEVVDRAAQWPLTLAGLVVYLAIATGILYLYFTRLLGYDPLTAYFCATPGGLNEMVLTGGAMGADDRTIALVHGSRILLVVLAIPFWFRFTEGVTATVSGAAPSISHLAATDAAVLIGCALVGLALGRILHLPAYRLVGPMVASGVAHGTGLTTSSPPWELVALAQVVVGSALGARFAGMPVARVLRGLASSLGSTALLLALTVAFAFTLAPVTGIERAPIVLAYSPGGLAEMSLVALALGVDAAFVAAHHVFRIGIIVIGAPLLIRIAQRRRR